MTLIATGIGLHSLPIFARARKDPGGRPSPTMTEKRRVPRHFSARWASPVRSGFCLALLAVVSLGGAARAEDAGLVVDEGTCLVRPKQVIQVGSPVFGVLAEVFADRAQTVSKGQLLAKLDTTVEQSQLAIDRYRTTETTQLDSMKTDLAWNERELARRQKLVGNMFSKANDIDEVVTKVEQDRLAIRKAEDDLHMAKLEAGRAEAQLNLKMIRSPINGVVTDLKLHPGEFIYEQTPIMVVAEIDPLTVDLVVPAERYRSIKQGAMAELHLDPPVDATLPARIDAIDPVIDAASNTFRVRLTLPNPGNAIPAGVKCSARFSGTAGE